VAERFSERFGLRGREARKRDEIPDELRDGFVMVCERLRLDHRDVAPLVSKICGVRFTHSHQLPDWNDISSYIIGTRWYCIYDLIEAIYAHIKQAEGSKHEVGLSGRFEEEVNGVLADTAVPWKVEEGRVVSRGSEAFEAVVHSARDAMERQGLSVANAELHEAMVDLSRRPVPDVTGAVQHAAAALEAVAREVAGSSSATFGQLIPRLSLPKPLDLACDKLWGFCSDTGRHIREGRVPSRADATLVVGFSASLIEFLLNR
jgi:hypothetical protein